MSSEIGARILRPLIDHTLVTGESLKFRIRACGIPRPHCSWKHNGRPLEGDTSCHIREESVSSDVRGQSNEIVFVLEIHHTTSKHEGTYTVTVSNKNGMDSSTANVTLLRELDFYQRISDLDCILYLIFLCLTAEYSGGASVPRFVSNLNSSSGGSEIEGSNITLTAEVEGFPEPQIRWFKDGKLLVTSGRLITTTTEIVTNRLLCKLSIHNSTSVDSGTYVCAATSASGTAISETLLAIKSTHLQCFFPMGGY